MSFFVLTNRKSAFFWQNVCNVASLSPPTPGPQFSKQVCARSSFACSTLRTDLFSASVLFTFTFEQVEKAKGTRQSLHKEKKKRFLHFWGNYCITGTRLGKQYRSNVSDSDLWIRSITSNLAGYTENNNTHSMIHEGYRGNSRSLNYLCFILILSKIREKHKSLKIF